MYKLHALHFNITLTTMYENIINLNTFEYNKIEHMITN